jgi:hypothetical protein
MKKALKRKGGGEKRNLEESALSIVAQWCCWLGTPVEGTVVWCSWFVCIFDVSVLCLLDVLVCGVHLPGVFHCEGKHKNGTHCIGLNIVTAANLSNKTK